MMSPIDDFLTQFDKLPPGDQASFLRRALPRLVPGYDPGIETHPDVCGGSACLVRTRIPVWTLQALRQQGMTEAQILASYPTLNAEDLVNAWAYARNHAEEIAREIQENEDA